MKQTTNNNGQWYDEVYEDELRFGIKVREVLFSGTSEYQRVEVLDTESFGRVLVLDGVFQTAELDEYTYHEMMVHPALCTAPSISKVLIIGGGDGGTAREVLRHQEVDQVVMIEIDGMVVEVSKQYLPSIGSAWDDPRLAVEIGDGIAYLQNAAPGSFDVVLVDSSDPVGPAVGLFNEAFYRSVDRALSPAGVLVPQSETPILVREAFMQIQQVLGEVFPVVRPYFGAVPLYSSGPWAWTFASRSVDPLELIDSRVTHVEKSTRYYNREIHHACFALPNGLAKELG